MKENIELRPAQPDDAAPASILLHSAYRHAQTNYPLQDQPENQFLGYLQRLFREEGNRFSYQYIQVAEQSTNVVGLVLSFAGRDEKQLNAAVGWQLECEAEDDEWYVDALAVFTDWGRKGIGTRLMQAAEQQARQQHYAKIALNVAKDNIQALSLYQRLHYVTTQETFHYNQHYVRMVKRLETL
jgi:ribosomal protein S18 acetylase RimI-like enzyme